MPRKRIPADVRSLARGHTAMCIKVLAGIAQSGESEGARVTAAGILLDRGWGRAPQSITGPNGEGDIRVLVRHIVEGTRDVPRLPATAYDGGGDG